MAKSARRIVALQEGASRDCITKMGELAHEHVGKELLAANVATRRRPAERKWRALMERLFTPRRFRFCCG